MRRTFTAGLGAILLAAISMYADDALDSAMPVRGFCISAPRPAAVPRFIDFIDHELAARHVNTLILRVDYNYQYQSHPELSDKGALSLADVKQLVAACKKDGIHLIPQINLLGHQSFHTTDASMLRVYPEFDETPWVKMPEHYKWPNPDHLYCRSYCPLHPKVHEVVFAIVDELCDAFEADAFHAGMDEVFYLGEDKCPRCAGKDKAQLFADEVTRIHDHVKQKNRALWIWGDRLIDGRITGLGEWEASYNHTAPAIDLIPKDTVICDWHYERADLTAPYFAMKGFDVISCPWKKASVGVQQAEDMINWRHRGPPEIRGHLRGVMQTVWSGVDGFLDQEYKGDPSKTNQWTCFTATFATMEKTAR
ncbi:MAG TPA: family 20 glycosylhydrolase [Verrucomicrobiae bacterium]|jgi:hypothetical protein|nr:family 20 glycosylhydrolase [Verrucomicrobiae bacterium]